MYIWVPGRSKGESGIYGICGTIGRIEACKGRFGVYNLIRDLL
jgi:hypothetical protein